MTCYSITVIGTPITQGSKTRTRHGMRDDNAARLRPWREAVKHAALDAGIPRIDGPVSAGITFAFTRPRSHFGTGRNANVLRASAPRYPATRGSGDMDKLCRAVFDALTDAAVWADDSQVVQLDAVKVWTDDQLDRPQAVIRLDRAVL